MTPPPESLLWEGRPPVRASLFELSSAAALCVLALLLLAAEHPLAASSCAAAALLAAAAGLLRALRRGYRITTGRLRAREGLLLRSTRELEFDAVARIELAQGLLQRLFGLADLVAFPKDPAASPLSFPDVGEPRAALDAAHRAQRERTPDELQTPAQPA